MVRTVECSLILLDTLISHSTHCRLYVLEKKLNRVAFMPSENPAFALNSKCINPKEEHWLENTSPGDILLQEAFNTPDTLSESKKVYFTIYKSVGKYLHTFCR